ncbi:2-oxoglutarate dehydrogenase E2 component [Reichenbachiella faecimaris]|uniref:Dihydrolipoyllysine-residue succinyltransferase component of 2-oxoglutarate dehydrogenase complex n=1 Tax=Reichenbachiella faecimaris TaxID=692418 RepID=A0A1W2GBH7_REIFA|nr:2-oxoglutarate dehydrogenase complex dihydrolipoyllysine-residue succinyltransferase [Reichenbachiella faecimaris]SMD33961.1 2-oxoglutarate dehydrogenase E2 component [Reichenbachiella faecimaris]
MIEVKIPTVGESITEVTVSQWTKQSGDYVEMDEVICELESDKATFELNAEAAGILTIKVEEGETIEIGTVVCTIDETAAGAGALSSAPTAKIESVPASSDGGKTGETLEMKVPTVGESITEVTIGAWMKQDGDVVELDEPIAEIESDKATFELAAEARGVLKIVAQEGDTIEIGALICKIDVMAGVASAPAAAPTPEVTAETPTGAPGYAAGHPSPAAAKILAEKGIPAGDLVGSGVGGRITKDDAQAAQKSSPAAASTPAKETAPAVPAFGGGREQTRKKLTPLRKTVAKRLVSVKNETAMLTTFNEVDMKPVMDLRKKYKDAFKDKYEVGLGFMSFFIKAACQALQEWPAVNAQIDGNEIVYNDFCDVSIAVSAPKGLVVPVIRNAESLSFNQVESEVVRLAKKARDNKLSIDEMQGGTFTVTNGGIFGSMLSTPIINAPQSAILGMHNIVERPVAINGQVEIRPIMYLALSYDHRIIDGKESVSFLVRIKELLEDPARLMLGI